MRVTFKKQYFDLTNAYEFEKFEYNHSKKIEKTVYRIEKLLKDYLG